MVLVGIMMQKTMIMIMIFVIVIMVITSSTLQSSHGSPTSLRGSASRRKILRCEHFANHKSYFSGKRTQMLAIALVCLL